MITICARTTLATRRTVSVTATVTWVELCSTMWKSSPTRRKSPTVLLAWLSKAWASHVLPKAVSPWACMTTPLRDWLLCCLRVVLVLLGLSRTWSFDTRFAAYPLLQAASRTALVLPIVGRPTRLANVVTSRRLPQAPRVQIHPEFVVGLIAFHNASFLSWVVLPSFPSLWVVLVKKYVVFCFFAIINKSFRVCKGLPHLTFKRKREEKTAPPKAAPPQQLPLSHPHCAWCCFPPTSLENSRKNVVHIEPDWPNSGGGGGQTRSPLWRPALFLDSVLWVVELSPPPPSPFSGGAAWPRPLLGLVLLSSLGWPIPPLGGVASFLSFVGGAAFSSAPPSFGGAAFPSSFFVIMTCTGCACSCGSLGSYNT